MKSHRFADMAPPIGRLHEFVARRHASAQIRNQRDTRRREPYSLRRLFEAVEHRLHQRGMECMRHRENPVRYAAAGQDLTDRRNGIRVAGDDGLRRPVDGGDRYAVGERCDGLRDNIFGRSDRGHRPLLEKRLHQAAALRDQAQTILQAEQSGDAGGSDTRRPNGRSRPMARFPRNATTRRAHTQPRTAPAGYNRSGQARRLRKDRTVRTARAAQAARPGSPHTGRTPCGTPARFGKGRAPCRCIARPGR